jgi:hypothetical protein
MTSRQKHGGTEKSKAKGVKKSFIADFVARCLRVSVVNAVLRL